MDAPSPLSQEEEPSSELLSPACLAQEAGLFDEKSLSGSSGPSVLVVGDDLADRLSVASLLRNFEALLADVDYREALDILEVGSLQFGRRKRIRRELQALYVGLWRLALKRSFPADYDAVFHAYLESQQGKKQSAPDTVNAELTLQYVDKLREHGDSDFSAVSRHILSLLQFDDSQTRALTLKIALHLRRIYTYFFDHLL